MEIQVKKKTLNQKDRILKYLEDFGSITYYEAVVELGVLQFGARIKELKEQGYNFKTEWISKKNRYGKNVAFKKYQLEVTNDKFYN